MGHGKVQGHGFPCPTCSIVIRYTVRLDPPRYDELYNGRWVDDRTVKAPFVIAFDPEILSVREGNVGQVVPAGDWPRPFSPFMAAVGLCRSLPELKKYQTTIARAHAAWVPVERLFVHYEQSNHTLLDKEIKQFSSQRGSVPDDVTRLLLIRSIVSDWQSDLLFTHHNAAVLFYQRWQAAMREGRQALTAYCDDLRTSGRLLRMWRAGAELRERYAELFSGLGAILQIQLWKKLPQDMGDVVVHDKRFAELKPLYVEAFEHMCRLSAVAIAAEMVLMNGSTDVPTNKGSMSIWKYEEMRNANKAAHVQKTSLADLAARMDTKLRNGIGHFQAYYEFSDDSVVCAKTSGPTVSKWSMPYAEFCRQLVDLCSVVFELDAYVFYAAEALGGALK